MNINIKTTGVSLTPDISKYIEKRLAKISKILRDDSSAQCDVEIAKTTEHHQKGEVFMAEIHIVGASKNYFSRSEKTELFSAIDDVRDQVLRELKAGKAKKVSLVRRSGARVKNILKGLWSWRGHRGAL